MALKKQVFSELDRVCKPGAILASNTSTLSIDEIASATSRPQFVIGTHFFSPANVMRLLEIVRGKAHQQGSDRHVHATFEEAWEGRRAGGQLPRLRRQPHVSPLRARSPIPGGRRREQSRRWTGALYEFGMAMGPLAVGDLAGLDVGWRIRKEYRHLEKPGVRQAFAGDRLCEMGRYGQKTGAGWYKYDEKPPRDPRSGSGRARAPMGRRSRHPAARDFCRRNRRSLRVCAGERRRANSRRGLRACAPSDIDIIYINGYGFPAYRGGPMWYADTVGLKKVYERVSEFHQQHGEIWQPAPLLERLAAQGKTFAQFGKEEGAAV